VTNSQPQNESSESAAVDELPLVEVREKTRVREQYRGRSCEWCGDWMPYDGRGRPPRYCSDAHRQRAYELRTAQARTDRDAAAGKLRTEPVREVVERTETVTKTVVRQGQPYVVEVERRPPDIVFPTSSIGWLRMLSVLTVDVRDRRLMLDDTVRAQLAAACDRAAEALRNGISASPAGQVPPPRRERRAAAKKRRKKGR
jgi:hypothetical protein